MTVDGATAAEADDGVSGTNRGALTAGLVLTVSMTAFEALAVAATLPAVVADLGGLDLYGWAFSGFMLATLIGIALAGGEADRRGAARPFAVGGVLFVCGLVGAGIAGSMTVIVLSRMVQGLGAGAISSVAYAAVGRSYESAVRPRILAMLSTAWVVPGLIGPALAGAVSDHLGWRWVFLGLAPLATAATLFTVPSLRRLGPAVHGGARAGGPVAALRLAAGAALVLGGLGADRIALQSLSLVAGVALGLPALRRLLPRGTLRARPGLPAAVATMGLLSFAFFGADVFVPLSLTAVRGQSTTAAGLALTAGTLGWTAGAWIQAALAPRRGRREMTTAGLLLTILGIVGVAGVLSPSVPAAAGALAWGVAGLGMGLGYETTALAVLECARRGEEGAASAAMQLANVLGTALGTGLGGAVIALATPVEGSPRLGILLVDGITIAAAMVAVYSCRGLGGIAPGAQLAPA